MIAKFLCVLSFLSFQMMWASDSCNEGNAPWYPSLAAFEHYNSGRTHVFPNAKFGGSFTLNNQVDILSSPPIYPSGYNMAYLNAQNAFIYGGGYGDEPGSIGAFVAKVNPHTLEPIWDNQLINTSENGEWDYPGSMGILRDGFLYVIYGYRLSKIDTCNRHQQSELLNYLQAKGAPKIHLSMVLMLRKMAFSL